MNSIADPAARAGESPRTFAISHQVSSGSATDSFDQTMRLASTCGHVLGATC